MEKEFIIKESQINALLTYLSKQVYENVYQGIHMLQSLEELKKEENKENVKK